MRNVIYSGQRCTEFEPEELTHEETPVNSTWVDKKTGSTASVIKHALLRSRIPAVELRHQQTRGVGQLSLESLAKRFARKAS